MIEVSSIVACCKDNIVNQSYFTMNEISCGWIWDEGYQLNLKKVNCDGGLWKLKVFGKSKTFLDHAN